MQQSIIRYRTKPDQADANAELVRAVYAELRERSGFPGSYSTLKRYVKTHLCGPGTVTALLAA